MCNVRRRRLELLFQQSQYNWNRNTTKRNSKFIFGLCRLSSISMVFLNKNCSNHVKFFTLNFFVSLHKYICTTQVKTSKIQFFVWSLKFYVHTNHPAENNFLVFYVSNISLKAEYMIDNYNVKLLKNFFLKIIWTTTIPIF